MLPNPVANPPVVNGTGPNPNVVLQFQMDVLINATVLSNLADGSSFFDFANIDVTKQDQSWLVPLLNP